MSRISEHILTRQESSLFDGCDGFEVKDMDPEDGAVEVRWHSVGPDHKAQTVTKGSKIASPGLTFNCELTGKALNHDKIKMTLEIND